MNNFINQTRSLGALAFLVACLLVGTGAALYAQNKVSGVLDPANGNGMMVAGELWDSYMPLNKGPYYSEATADILREMRIGNFERQWSSPTHMWPGGFNFGAYWNKSMQFLVWDPDPTFNPATIGGVANPSYYAPSGPNYGYAGYPNTARGKNIPGRGDPARDYTKETKWVDATKRHHAVYEAAHPTTAGVDVKIKVHQYSLNWNNFNDFYILELTFTNTGVVDMNADGTPEKTNHVIEAFTTVMHGELMMYHTINEAAGRGNSF